MSKLRLIRLYDVKDVPDHLVQEVVDLVDKLAVAIYPVAKNHSSNIVISAFNRFHALLICSLVNENDIKNAAETEAIGLMKNIEQIIGKKMFPSDENV